MAKLATMFLILIALQACLIIYSDKTPDNTDLWKFVTGMANWSSLGFIVTLTAIAAAVIYGGISPGGFMGFRYDFLIMAPAIGGLIGLGVVFTSLATVIRDELVSRIFTTCDLSTLIGCNPVIFIIAITVGPVAFYYAWTVVEWWRGKDF